MRRIKVSVAAAALLLAGAAAAQAADLPPPPMTPAAWSFSVFGGASWLNSVESSTSEVFEGAPFDRNYDFDFDTGFLVGGAFGYTLVDWARTEIEISYASYDPNTVDISTDFESTSFDHGGSLDELTVMGNLWLGFNMLPVVGDPVNQVGDGLGFSPYFGGGLGVAFVDVDFDSPGGDSLSESTTAFAWQVGAGVRWTFASNIGLDVGYRYRGVTDVGFGDNGVHELSSADLYSNNLIVGLTFNF